MSRQRRRETWKRWERGAPMELWQLDLVQASFSPDGELLVIAEKVSNTIDVFTVGGSGLLGQLTTTTSTGATPFGFDFDRAGHVVVSDAFGGAEGASALTSYRAGEDGDDNGAGKPEAH